MLLKLLTYNKRGTPSIGIVLENAVADLNVALWRLKRTKESFPDLGIFAAGGAIDLLRNLTAERIGKAAGKTRPLDEVALLAPVTRPPKIVAVGLNYLGHAQEQNRAVPKIPLLFAKSATSVSGPCEPIRLPSMSHQVDYEIELGVIIGRRCEHLRRGEAAGVIFGYTIALDITARDLQALDKQFYRAKSFPTFCPAGPVVLTADEARWDSFELELRLNGRVMQKASSREMIFSVPALLRFLSQVHPLEPGDMVLTGTPAGVGVFRNPPVFLKPADRIEACISPIGAMKLEVVAERMGRSRAKDPGKTQQSEIEMPTGHSW